MDNMYKQLKDRQQAEFNAFPLMCAFSDSQFKEEMESKGLTEDDTDKIYAVPGCPGCFFLREDAPLFHEITGRHTSEMEGAMGDPVTGDDFCYQMFLYELDNHEYSLTRDTEETVDALGLLPDEVKSSPRLSKALERAVNTIISRDCMEDLEVCEFTPLPDWTPVPFETPGYAAAV